MGDVTPLPLQWREMRDDDRNYVLSSWLRSYAEAPEFRSLQRPVYFALYEPLVKQLMARSTIAIAWTETLPESVLGWVAIEGVHTLHYACTKRRFRKVGIARWMLGEMRDLPVVYTHMPTLAATRLIGSAWTYDPMARFEKKAA